MAYVYTKTSDLIWQDKQHQVLFQLIDEITTQGAGQDVFPRLRDYAENHFVMEEEYMERLGFPGIKAHVRAHDRFREELETMAQNAYSYDEHFKKVLSEFLTEWLQRHVLGIDKELEAFILQSALK